MSTPTFEFTDRAAPIVQFGRPERPTGDDRWQTAHWGEGFWGKADWEPLIWTDLTCEIHQINTNTGRGSASDRFVPGTAHIIASNVHDVADMIFPRVPGPAYESELVPQPPIQHEETLQAPDAATIVSNGWSFSDDFETRPPRWIFPPAWTATGTVPYGPFKVIDEAFEPELYPAAANNWSGNAAAQWTRNYDSAGNAELAIGVTNLDWPATPSSGTPNVVVDLMFRMNTADKECDCARFTLTPNFAGANSVQLQLFHMTAAGAITAGGSSVTHTTGTGSGGDFGARTLSARITSDGFLHASMSGVFTDNTWTVDVPLSGGRIGMAMHYEQGVIAGTAMGAPRIIAAAGDDFEEDFTFPLGSGWILPALWEAAGFDPMFQADGSMQATTRFQNTLNGEYLGYGMAQWVSEFDGDQVLEVELSGVSMPRPSGGTNAQSYLEMYLHGNRRNRACMVVYVNYDPGWGATHSTINWSVWQNGPNGELIDYEPTVAGSIDVGATDGEFPEPDRWRVESDLNGEQRIYRNGTLLGTAIAPDPETGGRIGVHLNWRADNLFPNTQRRPAGARIDQLWAGLREPLGTEDLGIWIRIGVDHATLGNQWFLRGCVDGIVPTYVPDRPDAVRIECIDTLGEAGRVRILGDQLPHEFAPATTRIHQILNRAHWPRNLMIIRDDDDDHVEARLRQSGRRPDPCRRVLRRGDLVRSAQREHRVQRSGLAGRGRRRSGDRGDHQHRPGGPGDRRPTGVSGRLGTFLTAGGHEHPGPLLQRGERGGGAGAADPGVAGPQRRIHLRRRTL